MKQLMDRREFIRLAAFGGIVFASGVRAAGYGSGMTADKSAAADDFYFVQLSDTHWGFDGPPNPDSHGTLPKAIAAVNALSEQPDFVVFTGDLTHLTLDAQVRRARMTEFRDIVSKLKVRDVRFLPGEHDASVDRGEAFQEFFGPTHYTFDHKGAHFIVIDNVSDPKGIIGDAQLAWLVDDLGKLPKDKPIVVLTHRPLFDLQPEWGWSTGDGARAIELLLPFRNVSVFYGHIHQENQRMTGHILHRAAKSLIFPLPPPGSADHKPVPWDSAQPYRGLGWRDVEAEPTKAKYEIHEHSVQGG
ncbi:MAG TPA: metallophosphoesterase [Rhodocyclaceae bacterium]|nr:metallophosphoesterase [Rhodocyclaceae bacterium]